MEKLSQDAIGFEFSPFCCHPMAMLNVNVVQRSRIVLVPIRRSARDSPSHSSTRGGRSVTADPRPSLGVVGRQVPRNHANPSRVLLQVLGKGDNHTPSRRDVLTQNVALGVVVNCATIALPRRAFASEESASSGGTSLCAKFRPNDENCENVEGWAYRILSIVVPIALGLPGREERIRRINEKNKDKQLKKPFVK